MSKRRLNVWWRLGIVVTAFWMVGGTAFFAIREINEWETRISLGFNLCQRFNDAVPAVRQSDCFEEMAQSRRNMDRLPIWKYGAFIAGIIAIILWLIVGILYGSAGWVLAGRKPVEKPE